MSKVDGSISSLIQGVSQQPARERLPGQAELQENCSSDPVNGLTRRGPTNYVAQLIDSADSFNFRDYDGGSLGHFEMAHKAGEIKMFNLDGTENTVTVVDDAADYLPAGPVNFIGIDEDIYVVDPNKVVAMLPDTRSYVQGSAIVFLLGGQYGRKYTITIDYTEANGSTNTATSTYTAPNGSTSTHINDIATDAIMTQLAAIGGFTTVRVSDVLYITHATRTFTVTVSDGDGGSNMFAVNNQVDDTGRLPRFAPHGYLVKVSESVNATADDWYLEFLVDEPGTTVGQGFGKSGTWVETVAPGLEYKLDPATMPHILRKTGDGTFDFIAGAWGGRAVGDDETNPLPSFVGHTLNDISSFQGRLVLTSNVNVILSRTNKHTDFFNQSATTLADDDPIDISSSLGTFVLRAVVPHNRDLILFSDRAQFIMFGRNSLTPRNSSLVLTTEFETDLTAKPVGAGRNIFFSFPYGTYSGIQEFFTDGTQDVNDSRPITQHVLQYVVGTAIQLINTTNFSKLIVRTDADPKVVYIYEYIWLNGQKVQTSWSRWSFAFDVEHMFFVDSLLYLVQKQGNSYQLHTLDLDDTSDVGVQYRVYLDHKIKRDSVDTEFEVPYTVDDIANYVAVQGAGCPNPGLRAPIQGIAGNTVTLADDLNGGTIYFGRRYLSRYIPTTPYVRDQNGVKVGSGTLIIKQYTVHFDDTGFFRVVITDSYGYTASVTYNGRTLGAPTNLIGRPVVLSGAFSAPCKKNADTSKIEINTDSHLPMSLTEIEWIGQWRKKGRRIEGG